jgi:hypothetical protein
MTPIYVLVVFLLAADGHSSHAQELARFKDAQQCQDAQLASQKAYYGYKDAASRLVILGYFCETRDH